MKVRLENYVDDKVARKVKDICDTYSRADVCFNVVGKACNSTLASQLKEKLGDEYNVELNWNHVCVVTKVTDDETEESILDKIVEQLDDLSFEYDRLSNAGKSSYDMLCSLVDKLRG